MTAYKCKIFKLLSSFLLLHLSAMAQERDLTEYYFISADFYSIGQGIDKNAFHELTELIENAQTKNKVKLEYEQIWWGKEGERTVYIDLRSLPIIERQKFLQNLSINYSDRKKMAIVRVNLCYEPSQKYLILGISMFGQFETRENELLNYIAKWEKHSRIKINPGSMINETAIPEDQDRRNQFNLSGLKDDQIKEIVSKAQEIMKIRNDK